MREDIEEILTNFFAQTKTDSLAKSHYPRFYSGLNLKAGFGQGRVAKVAWIAFLGKDQKVTNGIFPVYYFFKDDSKLILAYGISEKEKPTKNWNAPPGTMAIIQYFRQFGKVPSTFGLSYVYEVYNTNFYLEYNKIESDLDNLLAYYKKIMQRK
jgi:5-methylcytosine-specific restriction protein B